MEIKLSLEKSLEEIEKAFDNISFGDRNLYEPYSAFTGRERGDIFIIPKNDANTIYCATWGEMFDGTIMERPESVRYVILDSSEKVAMVLADSIELGGRTWVMPDKELFALAALYYQDQKKGYHVRIVTHVRQGAEIPLVFNLDLVKSWSRLQYTVEDIDNAIKMGIEELTSEEV